MVTGCITVAVSGSWERAVVLTIPIIMQIQASPFTPASGTTLFVPGTDWRWLPTLMERRLYRLRRLPLLYSATLILDWVKIYQPIQQDSRELLMRWVYGEGY